MADYLKACTVKVRWWKHNKVAFKCESCSEKLQRKKSSPCHIISHHHPIESNLSVCHVAMGIIATLSGSPVR